MRSSGAAQAGCPDEHYLSGLFPWSPTHDPRSPALLQRVSQLHARLTQILQDSLPPTPSQAHSRRHNQVSIAWDTVLNSVRELIQTLRFALLSQPWRPPNRSLLDALRQQWNTAQQQYSRLVRAPVGHSAESLTDWDGFESAPQAWAQSRGFPLEVASQWRGPQSGLARAQLASPPDAAAPASPVDLLHVPLTPEDGSSLLEQMLAAREEARRLRSQTWQHRLKECRVSRVTALRSHNMRVWCRLMKPPRDSGQYAPRRVRLPSGIEVVPSSESQVRLGAAQEWTQLLQGPSPPWSHPMLRVWRDGLGHTRAAPNAEFIVSADPSCPAARVGRAYMEPGPFFGLRLFSADIRVHSASLVYVGSWCLQLPSDGDRVHACRLLPCPGLPAQLLAVNGDPAFSWSPERWHWASRNLGMICLVLWRGPDPLLHALDLVGPLDCEERRALVSRSRNSRPGQSGWKLAFLQFFPGWVQEAYWRSLDVQRGCGLVADGLKTGVQVNIPKTKGGYRPLTMLEEGFKAIEGPVTRRLARARQRLAPNAIYSSMNRAFDPGVSAAPEVLYTWTPSSRRRPCARDAASVDSPRTTRSSSTPSPYVELTQSCWLAGSRLLRGGFLLQPSLTCEWSWRPAAASPRQSCSAEGCRRDPPPPLNFPRPRKTRSCVCGNAARLLTSRGRAPVLRRQVL